MQIGAVGFIESMITCTLLLIPSGLDLTCLLLHGYLHLLRQAGISWR